MNFLIVPDGYLQAIPGFFAQDDPHADPARIGAVSVKDLSRE